MLPNQTLLPINTILTFRGKPLKVEHLISTKGLTSEVYRGVLEDEQSIPVAIKIMKTLSFVTREQALQAFTSEGLTLASLSDHEAIDNKEKNRTVQTSPQYYGLDSYENQPYLVMELIQGKKVEEELEEVANYPEVKALRLGAQLFRVLHILHTQLKLSYKDLKFEDLWVADGCDLKMMDFGTMEVVPENSDQPGVIADLKLASIHLYRMVTGRVIDPTVSQANIRINRDLHDANVSYGTAYLLRNILNVKSEKRLRSAEEIYFELTALIEGWEKSDSELIAKASEFLDKAMDAFQNKDQDSSRFVYARRARTFLDIALRKAPHRKDLLAPDMERAVEYTSIFGVEGRGKALLEGGSFATAKEILHEARAWSDDPASLRRWIYLCDIGIELSTALFDNIRRELFEIVERMNQSQFSHAIDRIHSLEADLGKRNISILHLQIIKADCELFENLLLAEGFAQRREWSAAAAAYQAAQRNLDQLPDKLEVNQTEVADLREQFEKYDQLARTEGEAQGLQIDIRTRLGSGDLKGTLAPLQKLLDGRIKDPEVLAYAEEAARRSITAGEFELATRFAAAVFEAGLHSPHLVLFNHQARSLAMIQTNLNDGNYPLALVWMNHLPLDTVSTPSLDNLVSDNILKKGVELSEDCWEVLVTVLAKAPTELASPLKEAREKLEKSVMARQSQSIQMASQLWVEAISILNLARPVPADGLGSGLSWSRNCLLMNDKIKRYQEAKSKIKDILGLDIPIEKIKTAEAKIAEIDQGILIWEQSLGRQKGEQEKMRQELISQVNVLGERLQRLESWAAGAESAGASKPVIAEVSIQKGQILADIFDRCFTYLSRFNENDEWITTILERTTSKIDEVGYPVWRKLITSNWDQIEKIRLELPNVYQLIAQKNLAEASAILARLHPYMRLDPDFVTALAKVTFLGRFVSWQDENGEILRGERLDTTILGDMRKFLEGSIPKVYWDGSPAREYLLKMKQIAEHQLKGLLVASEQPEFMDTLKIYIEIKLAVRQAELMVANLNKIRT